MLRSAAQGCALLVGGFARTAEAELLLTSGWARPIIADRTTVRASAPRIEAAGDDYATGADSAAAGARLSPAAFAAARAALAANRPVLVQVPRRGYLPTLSCSRCRRPARCRHCHGPLALGGARRLPACRWCGIAEAHFNCPACGSDQFRTTVVGARRTAEELGRAFPGVQLITSSGDTVRADVPDEPAIVVATPGSRTDRPIRSRPAAGRLRAARAGRPPGGRGDAPPVDGRGCAGGAGVARRPGGGRRGHLAADRAGADPLGPGRSCRSRVGGPDRTRFPAGGGHGVDAGRGSGRGAAADGLELPTGGEVLGPVLLEDLPAATGSRARSAAPVAGTARVLLRVPPSGRKQLAAAVKVAGRGQVVAQGRREPAPAHRSERAVLTVGPPRCGGSVESGPGP